MIFDPKIHHRRSIRIQGYDYAASGRYYVTIVTQRRACLLGDIANGVIKLSESGRITNTCWRLIPDHFPNVELGTFVIMPNHVHGIIILHEEPRRGVVTTTQGDATQGDATQGDATQGDETSPRRWRGRRPTLGQVVAYFKYQSTKQINAKSGSAGAPIWQRNYYEHIIRNEDEHNRIHLYIESNPDNWMNDGENPQRQL